MQVNDIISSGLLELYVMGLASAEEVRDVQAWAAQYPEVAAEIAAIEKGLESYAKAYGIQPADSVKDRVMASINAASAQQSSSGVVDEIYDTAPKGKVHAISTTWKWVAAASIVLLIGSAVMNVVYYGKYSEASKGLESTKDLLAAEQQRIDAMKNDMDMVLNPNSVQVSSKGLEVMPDATAKIFWMQNTGEVMIDASRLPDAPAGMQYQFWGIVDGKPVDGGMIITNDKGKKFRMQKMRSFGKAQAFAISLEKEGGNPTPTKVVSMGTIL